MNRIARTLAALIVASSLTAAVAPVAQAAPVIAKGNHWCC